MGRDQERIAIGPDRDRIVNRRDCLTVRAAPHNRRQGPPPARKSFDFPVPMSGGAEFAPATQRIPLCSMLVRTGYHCFVGIWRWRT
jgi:hypothetical protein